MVTKTSKRGSKRKSADASSRPKKGLKSENTSDIEQPGKIQESESAQLNIKRIQLQPPIDAKNENNSQEMEKKAKEVEKQQRSEEMECQPQNIEQKSTKEEQIEDITETIAVKKIKEKPEDEIAENSNDPKNHEDQGLSNILGVISCYKNIVESEKKMEEKEKLLQDVESKTEKMEEGEKIVRVEIEESSNKNGNADGPKCNDEATKEGKEDAERKMIVKVEKKKEEGNEEAEKIEEKEEDVVMEEKVETKEEVEVEKKEKEEEKEVVEKEEDLHVEGEKKEKVEDVEMIEQKKNSSKSPVLNQERSTTDSDHSQRANQKAVSESSANQRANTMVLIAEMRKELTNINYTILQTLTGTRNWKPPQNLLSKENMAKTTPNIMEGIISIKSGDNDLVSVFTQTE